MSSQTAADMMIETIYQWGVRVVFGIPGDGINGIIESFRKREKDIAFIQVRHEEAAAFAATAYAKLTGKLGVCVATSGPGGLHLLNGLYDAKMDGAPVLAITGLQFHDLVSTYTQQDVELDKVFQDVCVYNARVMGAAHAQNVTELACRTALTRRGVSHITMPVDLQDQPVKKDMRSMRNIPNHVGNLPAYGAGVPSDAALDAAAAILNAGKKITIMAGRGALGQADLLEQVAEMLGAPICKPLLGKGCFPDDSPYCTGSVGLLGTKPSSDALDGCDTLLIVGSTLPWLEYYPKPGQARGVQIDVDGSRIGLRYPVEAGLVGTARETLQALLPKLKRNADRAFLEEIRHSKAKWQDLMDIRASVRDKPMKPQVVAKAVNDCLTDDAIILSDSGTITTWYARHIHIRKNQMCTLSGNLATMACSLPYAIGAQVAYPNRQVVTFTGDGGFTMLMAEMITAKKYNLPIKVVVFKNNSLGQIRWEQMVMLGNAEYVCDLEPFDFVKYADAVGIAGYRVEDPATCGEIMRQALADPRPTIIEAVVDNNEPPLPAKIKWEQAVMFTESLAKGTRDWQKVLLSVGKDMAREML